MFHHLSRDGSLLGNLPTLHRRVGRTRIYLSKSSPNVMVWAGAIPYDYLESLLLGNPNFGTSGVRQALREVLVAEEHSRRSLKFYCGLSRFASFKLLQKV